MSSLRILVADDHEIVRRGLLGLLEAQPGWQVCGEAANGREAVEKAKRLKPDVVVLDISMPEMNGLEASREILQALPKTEILVLSMHESEELTRELLAAGVRGYVMKSDAASHLVAAVEALAERKSFFSPSASEIVVNSYLKALDEVPRDSPADHDLTARERQIVQLLAEGKSNKQIASALRISIKTAETHRSNIMHKLGFHSVTQLVRYAIRNKIIGT